MARNRYRSVITRNNPSAREIARNEYRYTGGFTRDYKLDKDGRAPFNTNSPLSGVNLETGKSYDSPGMDGRENSDVAKSRAKRVRIKDYRRVKDLSSELKKQKAIANTRRTEAYDQREKDAAAVAKRHIKAIKAEMSRRAAGGKALSAG